MKLQVTGTRYEPTTVEQHLELAEEHLAAVRRHIADQRDLEGAGPDPTEIRHLLAELETAQALHIREKILRVLEEGLLPERSHPKAG